MVTVEMQPADVTAIESALSEIVDIDAFHVVPNINGNGDGSGIAEIHVVTSSKKSPKQLVRDIESLLMAKHKLTVDRKKISVAKLAGKAELTVRANIDLVATETRGNQNHVIVRLVSEGQESEGRASGSASKAWSKRLVALSTLDAVAGMSKQVFAFALEDVTIVSLARESVAMVAVSIMENGAEQLYCGAAIIKHDEKGAIARATLDAVNRRMSYLTT